MKIVLDTSALLSLAAGNILELVIDNIDSVVPERVQVEIKGLSKNNDFEGNLAKHILNYLKNDIVILQSYKSFEEGEIECAYVANESEEIGFLITDDIAAIEKLEKICIKKVRFSPLIIYALCLAKKITKNQALKILERMRVKRNWKDNCIFEQAIILLENL